MQTDRIADGGNDCTSDQFAIRPFLARRYSEEQAQKDGQKQQHESPTLSAGDDGDGIPETSATGAFPYNP